MDETQRSARSGGRQAPSVRGRRFDVGIPSDTLARIQAGVFKTRYKGLQFCKNPFDIVLYLRLLETLRPRTVIEVGSLEGGGALWFRDQVRAFGLGSRVIGIDIEPPAQSFDGVEFHAGDAYRPEATFPTAVLDEAPHPWLVIEDSAHVYETVSAVLGYFDARLVSGDYMVVEDGVVADLPPDEYGRFADGPNRAVGEFLTNTGGRYAIDEELCDFYGPNVTYCPNAWLVRT